MFGPVAQLEVQAGQLYAPRFGGVTQIVAIRFTSHKRKFYKMRHVTHVLSIRAISSAGRASGSVIAHQAWSSNSLVGNVFTSQVF
jgi:hypothetical protein